MRIFTKLPSWSNTSAGATASLQLPVRGPTYEELILKFSGVTLAQMKNIRLQINGKPVQEFSSGTELKFLNDYYARKDNTASGYISLWMTWPEEVRLANRRLTGIGTLDVSTLELLIDIDGAATAPVIETWAWQARPAKLGVIRKVKRFSKAAAAAGVYEIDSIPKPLKHNIQAVHFLKSDAASLEITKDSIKIYDTDKTVGAILQSERGRVPQDATATHWEATIDGDSSEGLAVGGVQDLRFKPTLTTSGSVNVIVEYLGEFAGI